MVSPVAGIGWHMLGAIMAASFYIPIERVKTWSWETTWSIAGFFSWIVAPIGVSLLLLPHFHAYYAAMGWPVLLRVAAFGALWGVGSITYGLTVRYIGLSLGIGMAQGTNLAAGTLLPPIVNGQFAALLQSRAGLISLAGVAVALVGVAIVAWAGHERELVRHSQQGEFNISLGILLAVACGLSSSGMAFAIDAARPMQQAALNLGMNPYYSILPSYVFIMGAGSLVNWAYCFFRMGTLRHNPITDMRQPASALGRNLALAATGGFMWYLQFFFYAWGQANIPGRLAYVNWMLHMSGYVLFAGFLGLMVGEWTGIKGRPLRLLWTGILIIIAAANLVGLGMAS